MKNFAKFLGIIALVAVIGFSMTACADDDDDNGGGGGGGGGGGTLTITGLGDYDNLYAKASYDSRYTSDFILYAHTGNSQLPGKISDGKVTLNVYDEYGEGFTGSGAATLAVWIFTYYYDVQGPGNVGTVTVTFTNGSGEGAFVYGR